MSNIRKHLTYSNVMVTVLAFIVLGGTAWAVAKNSVGSKQIKAGAVKTADIKDQAITAAKVQDGSLGVADLAPGVIPAEDTATVRSASATVPLECTETNAGPNLYFVNCNGRATVTAQCESGEHATGGGYLTPPADSTPPISNASVGDSRPEPASGTPDAWTITAFGNGSNTGTTPGVVRPSDPEVTVYAVCSR